MISTSSDALRPHLVFRRDKLQFAVAMKHLYEVIVIASLRPLPAAESSLAGFAVLRGTVMPVFDPVLLLDSTPTNNPGAGFAVVIGIQERPSFALLAQEIGKVIQMPSPGPLSGPARIPACFSGELVSTGQCRVLLLDVIALAQEMGLVDTLLGLEDVQSVPGRQPPALVAPNLLTFA